MVLLSAFLGARAGAPRAVKPAAMALLALMAAAVQRRRLAGQEVVTEGMVPWESVAPGVSPSFAVSARELEAEEVGEASSAVAVAVAVASVEETAVVAGDRHSPRQRLTSRECGAATGW